MYESLEEALAAAERDGISLGEAALRAEEADGIRPRGEVEAELRRALEVMRQAIDEGLSTEVRSVSGLVRGSATRYARRACPGCAAGAAGDGAAAAKGKAPASGAGVDAAADASGRPGPLAGTLFSRVIASALAVGEVNAAMGIIVAAPTAGAAGVLPAVLLGIGRERSVDGAALVRGLAAAGLVGAVIAARASISGAEGGCQAETGSAAAMAAAAAVEVLGGTPREAAHAAALALQGTLGLVCDPIAGLVEVPCVFRNATASAIALAGIEMALAGVEFPIPIDEVIDAAGEIGRSMSARYRETAGGGLAATPTGRRLAKEVLGGPEKKGMARRRADPEEA